MKKFLLFSFLVLISCSSNNVEKKFNFTNDMTINEFKNKLQEYAKNKPYPDIKN
jgi:hypothetical protein